MDKEGADGAEAAGKAPPDGLLDAAGLFGAYWGRDGAAAGGAAAQAQAQAQAALFGFGSRYPPPTTLGVAANQAASLGLHPAASAAWWSMASHLAAQDYLARLQASGLNFPPLGDPYAALSALSGSGMKQAKPVKPPSRNDRSGRSSTSSSTSTKDKSPSTSSNASQPNMRSSYGFPKTSSPSTMHSQASLSSLASLNSLVSAPHQSKSAPKQPTPPTSQNRKSSGSCSSKGKDRELALLRGDLMLAQAAAHGAYHAAVAAAAKGKNMSPLYPFGMPGSEKDRHSAIDSLTGLPHTILSDPSSVLGGVRLPPDTEIIKYTSSLVGPKQAPPGSTNRGRKKTISLDPPQVSVHPSTGDRGTPLPTKRPKVEDYGNSRSSVEVIRLPNKPDRSGHNSVSGTPPPNLSDYAGISRELLQTIASQSGVSLAALERQLAGSTVGPEGGMNLSGKSMTSPGEDSPLDLGLKSAMDEDTPLNLSLKPTPPSTQASDALSRLTSLSSSLSASSNNERISRRKPGAKPRRVVPELNCQVADSPRPKSSGSEDSESIPGWPSREARPRNLGRGVSKPKKNTVASLLAQSRALGLRPALAQQLLGETDLEKLRALLGESASTDSECVSDSCPSDSDASDTPRRHNDAQLRLPLALGWKRVTVIKGLSRNCSIKGDVTYNPPEPHSSVKVKSAQELHAFLESNPCPPLCVDNFSFSARTVLGEYVQPCADIADPLVFNETEITKRLEEARALAAASGPRPTPPPLDRRMELARLQQAARDARRDATHRSRDQARLVREFEKSEKAELAKREKEARSQQLLEHINKNRTQLTIEPLPTVPKSEEWKMPDIVMGPALKPQKDRTMPPISLSLIPVNGPKDQSPIKNILEQPWKNDAEEYNALDKMKDFAEKAAFDLPKRRDKYDVSLMKTVEKKIKAPDKENNLEKLIESYSRISEFINGCDWSKMEADRKTEDTEALEQKYLDAKNEFMSQNLSLMPKDNSKSVSKEVIDLSEDDDNILSDIITKKINKGTFNIGKDGALSISVQPYSNDSYGVAKKRKQEELEKQKIEEQVKRQQEREIKRQQAILLKEQERERRRQHTTFIRQLDSRRRWEERERRKHQNLLDRLLVKEKKLQQRRKEMELLSELRRPQEDSTLSDQKPLPTLSRIPGLKLPGQAMADILQVFEFINNFGQTLGFDMDSIPTLNTFQMALLPDCSADAEEELVQVLTQLLITAIEDPGIPHPGRHTTLLGHAIRMGDITPHNLSEVLRIYLYANATGEVKALTGLTAERERERRIADHHQNEAEMLHTSSHTKNIAYYEHLHNNNTYKLSEALRDKPFLALNATTKAKILAFLCDELLQNKAVLRQIDGSLDHLNHLRKERYLMDMKIRKVRVLHQRKMRSEQAEKQQALALERMQRLVEESTANLTRSSPHRADDEPMPMQEKAETPKKLDKDVSSHTEVEDKQPPDLPSPFKDNQIVEDSDKELSPLKDLSNSMKNKELMNNNKEECSLTDNSKMDKDSVIGDDVLSDLESEGTQPEEDEDKNLSAEELSRKLEKLLRQSEQQLQQLQAGSHALRATCYGQDRYWRRYWSLGKCGGIMVEGMESAQPEIMQYHQNLENIALQEKQDTTKKKKKGVKEKKEAPVQHETEQADTTEAQQQEEALKSQLELKNIKSELNLSDHTQIIKYEPNVKHGACKVEGSSIKMEEKYIQQKQHNEEQDMLDIEDSIPTAFLVQKPTHKPMYATQAEPVDRPQEIIKVENVKAEDSVKEEAEETKDEPVNNLEELRKMAEAVSSQLDAAKKAEEIKQEKEISESPESLDSEVAHAHLYSRMLESKWFSILRHETSFLTNINEPEKNSDIPKYCDNDHTCAEVVISQGHKWDVSNNLHLLNDPSLFTLNSMVTSVQVPSNNIYTDSSLTMSGLDQDMMDASFNKEREKECEIEKEDKEQENDLEKELQADALKIDPALQKAKATSLTSLGLLNFNALSTYVTCDSPPPIHMSPEELDQLEYAKAHGLPDKLDNNYVPRELRHGWWRITDPEQLKELMESLHLRGVRERELHAALVNHVPTINNKLYIEKGDIHSTEFSVSHVDRVIAANGGFPSPDAPGSYSASTARRIDLQLLKMVEQLEDRVAASSMQVKGWRPFRLDVSEDESCAEVVPRARHTLAALEAHIERRYLKPPLVQRYASTTEANIGAVLQGEHGNSSTPSPQNSDGPVEGKENKGIARGLATWREAVARCSTSAQLAMLLHALEAAVAWDKSIMKANCQFCLSGDDEDQLLLCDSCDKGYHTYCFKPRMDKIPEGDWYCWECVNKARGERVCIVCGGACAGRTIPCALCVRAYHQDCHYPPLNKNPRGKWYCNQCISRAPSKKPRNTKKRESKHKDKNTSLEIDQNMVPSPAPSHASTSTTAEECSASVFHTPEKTEPADKIDETLNEPENGITNHAPVPVPELNSEEGPPPEKRRALQYVGGNGALQHEDTEQHIDGDDRDTENVPVLSRAKKEKNNAKKAVKDMQFCKNLLCEMECHEHAWPFLLPVNTKQFPQYKKVIKCPMDLSTIKRKLQDSTYKCKEEFASDVRLIFSNCEVFNEDYSPVGRAGHNMRQFFEERWAQC